MTIKILFKEGYQQINSIGRKAALIGAITAGAMILGASCPIKTAQQDKEPLKTELMSKESAEALKINSLQQTTPGVPTVNNQKLDKILWKFSESDEDKPYFSKIVNNMYKNYGTYLGSVFVQHEIDVQMLYALITRNTNVVIKNNINPSLGRKIEGFGDPFFATVTPHSETIDKWIDSYMPAIKSNLRFDHKPTAQEVNDRLDFIAENQMGFDSKEIAEYYVYTGDFLKHQIKGKTGTQAMSDILAYKMFMIDRLIFAKELRGVGVFGRGSYEDKDKTIDDYYKDWMESVEPKGD